MIPMLAMIPLLALPYDDHAPKASDDHGGHGAHDAAHAATNLLEGLPGWAVTLATLGVIAGIILAGIFLIPLVFRFIHAARLREMYTAITLLIVVGIGYLMTIVGLSPALGTFLAGVVLANSEFRHELESDIEPFKGLLLGLFSSPLGQASTLTFCLEPSHNFDDDPWVSSRSKAPFCLPSHYCSILRGAHACCSRCPWHKRGNSGLF